MPSSEALPTLVVDALPTPLPEVLAIPPPESSTKPLVEVPAQSLTPYNYVPLLERSSATIVKRAEAVVEEMQRCLDVVMAWQNVEIPSRLAPGAGDQRKLTLRIREQPVNFMIVIHQSTAIAETGQDLSRRGMMATKVLLGEVPHSISDREQYIPQALQEISTFAVQLKRDTSKLHSKFRLLRSAIFDIHMELDKVTTKKERLDFMRRLSRLLSKDVRECDDLLIRVKDDLEGIEKALNSMIRWWQDVEAEINYLKRNGESKLAEQCNRIRLCDIKDSFVKLESYFAEYLHKTCKLYDENIKKLPEANQIYVDKLRNCDRMIPSRKTGRLEAQS